MSNPYFLKNASERSTFPIATDLLSLGLIRHVPFAVLLDIKRQTGTPVLFLVQHTSGIPDYIALDVKLRI